MKKKSAPPLFHKPMAEEHKRALKIKDAEHVLVCLGNPPYGRHAAADVANHAITGGWVRYGDEKHPPILEDFIEPARQASFGIDLKNLYNQYIYFILWVLEKTVEGYPTQNKLLDDVLAGPLFLGAELPAVPAEAREAPSIPVRSNGNRWIFCSKKIVVDI